MKKKARHRPLRVALVLSPGAATAGAAESPAARIPGACAR